MKKANFFNIYLFWQLVIPFVGSGIFNLLYCILYSNYYYLPTWLDFLINVSYQLSYLVINVCLFISIGIVFYCILFKKAKEITFSILFTLISFSTSPFYLVLIKTIFFDKVGAPITGEEFKYILESDYLLFFQNITKFIFALIFIVVVTLVYKKGLKKEPKFEKPYISFKGIIQETLIVYYLAWFIYSFVLFITSADKSISGIIIELVYAIVGYLGGVYGSYYVKKKFETLNK